MYIYICIFLSICITYIFQVQRFKRLGLPRTSATGPAGCMTWAAAPRCMVHGIQGYPMFIGISLGFSPGWWFGTWLL